MRKPAPTESRKVVSGESAEILRSLERIPAGCRLVGITNTPGSLLAKVALPLKEAPKK